MSWYTQMIPALRVLINDMDCTSYTDTQLKDLLAVASMYVQLELDFTQTYTITMAPADITPDPASVSVDGVPFSNLTVMKAACMVDWNTLRAKALVAGLEARCGPAVLRTLKHLDGFKELLEKGPCAAYEMLKEQWMFGKTKVIHAILSPFVSNDFDPRNLASGAGYYARESRYLTNR